MTHTAAKPPSLPELISNAHLCGCPTCEAWLQVAADLKACEQALRHYAGMGPDDGRVAREALER